MDFGTNDWIVIEKQTLAIISVFLDKKQIEEYKTPFQILKIEKHDEGKVEEYKVTDTDERIRLIKLPWYRLATEEEIEKIRIQKMFNKE